MRVAIHHPPRQENGQQVEGEVSAFRTGRIEDHTDILTGETYPPEKVAEILAEQAKAEFPDCEIRIEYLHDNGDGTSSWKDHKPGDEEAMPPAGETHEQELAATQSTEGAEVQSI